MSDDVSRLFRLSADQGISSAQNKLGLCYLRGRGVPKDEGLAKFWWRKSASQGDETAIRYLEEVDSGCEVEDWE